MNTNNLIVITLLSLAVEMVIHITTLASRGTLELMTAPLDSVLQERATVRTARMKSATPAVTAGQPVAVMNMAEQAALQKNQLASRRACN